MTTTTPTPGTFSRFTNTTSTPHPERVTLTTTEAALRAILAEVTPGSRPYSTDSYLPEYMIDVAKAALDGDSLDSLQHAHNALSTAAWHCARGELPQALARMRRAQSRIKQIMEGCAA